MHQYCQDYLERVRGLNSHGTFRLRRAGLRDFTTWLSEHEFDDPTTIDDDGLDRYFIDQINKGYAPNTIEARYTTLHLFYEYLTDRVKLFDASPFEKLKRSEYLNGSSSSRKRESAEMMSITKEEKNLMCEHVPPPKLRNELILRLLWQTGMRKNEIRSVKLTDIDFDNRKITNVHDQKTKTERTVFYKSSLDILLEQWLHHGYRSGSPAAFESPYLFPSTQSPQISTQTLHRIVHESACAAGIQKEIGEDASGTMRYRISPHSFRHGFAMNALKCEIDVRTLQKLMGHSTIEMTTRYLDMLDDDIQEVYRKFDP